VAESGTNDVVVVHLDATGDPTGNAAGALADSLETWSTAPGSVFRVVSGASSSAVRAFDGENVVTWPASWSYPSQALAITTTTYVVDSGDILDADVELNPSVPWSSDGDAGSIDLESVLVHELGHVAGLGHVDDPSAVMYPSINPGTVRRALTPEDVAAIDATYPVLPFAVAGRDLGTRRSFAGTVATCTDSSPHALSTYTASVAWGDGTRSSGVVTRDRRGVLDVSAAHTYPLDAAWSATVTVTRAGSSAAGATSASTSGIGATTCDGLVSGFTLAGDTEVPPNGSCLLVGVHAGRDVTAQPHSHLVVRGGDIGRDLVAGGAAFVGVGGATVRRDLRIVGIDGDPASSAIPAVCGTSVGRDVIVDGNRWTIAIGDRIGCLGPGAANSVSHDLSVTRNDTTFAPSPVRVSGNAVGHDLVCHDNNPASDGDPRSNPVGHAVSTECAGLAR
jgi:hypothetical protein